MSSGLCRSALMAALLCASPGLSAQTPTLAASAFRQPIAQEVGQERSPLAAALLQAVLPPLPLGYLYAGDLGRSLLPTGLMVGGTMLVLVETVEILDWTDDDGSGTLLRVGLVAVVGGYLFGIWDAAAAARDHNDRMRRLPVPALALMPTPTGTSLLIRLEWSG